MDKYHITRYQDLQHLKTDWKGVLRDYSENIKASISSLQNKSYAAIKSTIYRSYKSITLKMTLTYMKLQTSIMHQI